MQQATLLPAPPFYQPPGFWRGVWREVVAPRPQYSTFRWVSLGFKGEAKAVRPKLFLAAPRGRAAPRAAPPVLGFITGRGDLGHRRAPPSRRGHSGTSNPLPPAPRRARRHAAPARGPCLSSLFWPTLPTQLDTIGAQSARHSKPPTAQAARLASVCGCMLAQSTCAP